MNGLYALQGETLGGLAPQPLTFTQGKGTEVTCYFLANIKNGKLTASNGAKPLCKPTS